MHLANMTISPELHSGDWASSTLFLVALSRMEAINTLIHVVCIHRKHPKSVAYEVHYWQ